MVVKNEATHWPTARRTIFGECGPHQIAAALRAHGQDVGIDDLYVWPINRHYDVTMPWDPTVVLNRYGIKSRWPFWFENSFLRNLKHALAMGRPVLITILSIQHNSCLHWISAWGYDETSDEFLCYDSQCETVIGNQGNVRYTSKQLVESLPWHGTFVVEILT
jgi:hypothetical protein